MIRNIRLKPHGIGKCTFTARRNIFYRFGICKAVANRFAVCIVCRYSYVALFYAFRPEVKAPCLITLAALCLRAYRKQRKYERNYKNHCHNTFHESFLLFFPTN